jgi:hypothetical protein
VVEERIREVFAGAGAEGLLHAVPVDARPPGEVREVAVGADEPVVIASIFKVLLVLEFARQVAAGQLDPRERVRVTAADRLGGWGTAGRATTHRYVSRLLRALGGPDVVVPVHWDNFEEPLGEPPRRDPSMDLDGFLAQVHRESPASRIAVPDYRTVYGGDMRPRS